MYTFQQEAIKKRDLLSMNSSLKDQNIKLEKENIQNLEMLKQHKQKVLKQNNQHILY